MGCEIRDASYCIALHLHIWAQHLTDQRFQPPEFDYQQLVVRFKNLSKKRRQWQSKKR